MSAIKRIRPPHHARRQPPESPVELQDTLARRSHTELRRRRHDVSLSGRPESNVATGWWLETQSFPQCYKRAPLPVPRCSSRGSLQATSPLFASASGSHRQRFFATLHSQCREAVSGLNARPLPLCPTGLVPTSVLLKGRSMPPASWLGRVRSPHQQLFAQPPALASVCQSQQCPQAEVDKVGPDSGTRARIPAPSEKS